MKTKYFFIVSALLLFSCSHEVPEKIKEEIQTTVNEIVLNEKQIDLADMELAQIKEQNLSEKIFAKGRIISKPQNTAQLSVPINGYVSKIYVQNGENVRKGQKLVSFKHPDYIDLQKNYLQTKVKLAVAEKNYNRLKTLSQNNAGNAKQLEAVESEFQQLKIELNSLRLKLSLIGINTEKLTAGKLTNSVVLTAPISGNVNELNIAIGKFVNPEYKVLELIANNDYVIELRIFERDIHKVAVGQKLSYDCSVPESNKGKHSAKITHISNYINEETKTFKVQAVPQKCISGMTHGIYIDAKIFLNENKLRGLPETAVFYDEDKPYAFVLENDSIIKKQSLAIGRQLDDFYEILNSEEVDNKQFVVKGGNFILSQFEMQ